MKIVCCTMQWTILVFVIMLSVACKPKLPEGIAAAMEQVPSRIDYNLHVKPILSDRCFACHGPDKNAVKAELQLHEANMAYAESPNIKGQYAIVPGDLRKSEVFHRLTSDDVEVVMPPPESNLHLSNYEKSVLIKWIEQGAEYNDHWSFINPKKTKLPITKDVEWSNNEIDHFVLGKLEMMNWQPKVEADKEILLRRVSLDMTGLPPSLREMDDFLNDSSPDAYEKVVNRLLGTSAYGERMATDWMDIARFADTHGYTVDRYRDMSPWRDWVIKAFNDNMSFDKFIIWQLAGDLLPKGGNEQKEKEQILATGFNRNHQQNMEGGIVGEEFRVEYVADRTNTLGAAFLGLTLECARCHDHKYDPISQKDYYQLFSFFNNINEAGQISWNNAIPGPSLLLTDEELDQTIAFIEKQIKEQENKIVEVEALVQSRYTKWMQNGRFNEPYSNLFSKSQVAHFDFENNSLKNKLNPLQVGKMKQQFVSRVLPQIVDDQKGKVLSLDGDAWLDLEGVGVFDRVSAFSIAISVKLPGKLENGVLFHKGDGAALYNFRGYHLALKNNRLEVVMAHTTPYNAIVKYGGDLPRDEWIDLVLTYDGSSKASGLKVYLNDVAFDTKVEQDNLYKDILFNSEYEPGLQIGGRWRGVGIKGALVDDIKVYTRKLSGLEVLAVQDLAKAQMLFRKNNTNLTQLERSTLREWFMSNKVTERKFIETELHETRKVQNEMIDTIKEIMVMQEMSQPRKSYILERGQYDNYGERVYSMTPESIMPMPKDFPKNRLGLAQWLVQEDNPLVARVIVNRYWQQFFGVGLVKSADDFGNQGNLPSHPQLLDWLAVEFIESGWDVKAIVKKIVLSATYRQSSIANENDMEDGCCQYLYWKGTFVTIKCRNDKR